MAKAKAALEQYFVAKYTSDTDDVDTLTWLRLAKNITNAEPDNSEETEDFADFDGNGTVSQTVTSVSTADKFTGYRDTEDEAQNLICSLRKKTGDDRYIWYAKVDPAGNVEYGIATALDIVDGGGEASAFRTFEAKLQFNDLAFEGTATAKTVTALKPEFKITPKG